MRALKRAGADLRVGLSLGAGRPGDTWLRRGLEIVPWRRVARCGADLLSVRHRLASHGLFLQARGARVPGLRVDRGRPRADGAAAALARPDRPHLQPARPGPGRPQAGPWTAPRGRSPLERPAALAGGPIPPGAAGAAVPPRSRRRGCPVPLRHRARRARPAQQAVRAGPAEDRVGPRPAADHVVAAQAPDRVVARQPGDHVAPVRAPQHVAARRAHDRRPRGRRSARWPLQGAGWPGAPPPQPPPGVVPAGCPSPSRRATAMSPAGPPYPATTMRPSGRSAIASALSVPPRSMVRIPPMPKVGVERPARLDPCDDHVLAAALRAPGQQDLAVGLEDAGEPVVRPGDADPRASRRLRSRRPGSRT